MPSACRRGPAASVVAVVLAAAGLVMGSAAPAPADAALASGQLTLRGVASGFVKPLGIVNAGDGSGRLFIVQQGGTVRVVQNGKLLPGDFLDISDKLGGGGERGLLGIAFDPSFETNRRLYAHYTRSDGDVVISRFTANSAKTSAPSSSERVLFTVEHSSQSNHNGGELQFGPDGYLYVAIGDGGSGQSANGQDLGTRLGKILRIDVNANDASGGEYGYPIGNPYVGGDEIDDATFASGLRNPWRFSFDRATGDLWIADVGQNLYEEVDRDAAPLSGGRDYGWDTMEGKHCYNASSCDVSELTLPIAEYSHAKGCSITGGYVYRGASQHDLQGLYVFADYCSGRIWTMASSGSTAITERLDTSLLITTFGESESGELYLVNQGGGLFRVIAPEFSDIAPSTFLDDIHWIFYEGLTVGCTATRYCPTDAVTREQMAIFLDRALNLPSTAVDAFTDDDGMTGEGAINRIAAAGITTGCTDTTFCPDAVVTREQMASFLARALELDPSSSDFFTDDDTSTHESNINRIAAAGITTGCTLTTYCPKASVTRAQMAAFLRRAFE
jgi:glucose/arabinose dehydrogenase